VTIARALLAAVLAASLPTTGVAQATRAPVIAVAQGDSVRIYIVAPPAVFHGFVVYGGTTGGTLTRLSAEPVRPVRDPARASEILADQLTEVLRVADVPDANGLLRKLDLEVFGAALMSLQYPRVATMLGRRWSDGGRAPGAEVSYRIVYVDAAGRETNQAVTTRVTMTDVLPGSPTRLLATQPRVGTHLTWGYPTFRGGDDFAFGYHVYRSRGATGMPERLTTRLIVRDESKAPQFEDPSPPPGTALTYTVRAVDILGREGPPSLAATITLADRQAPEIPVSLQAVEGDGRVVLTWPASPELDLRGYFVERGPSLDKPFTRLNRVALPPNTRTFTDSSLRGGTQYFFRIVAVDTTGNESRPSNSISTLPVDRTPPAPPTALRARVVTGRKLQVDWTRSPSVDVLGYYVYRGEVGAEATRITRDVLPANSILDFGPDSIGLRPGRRYRVTVSAVDGSFNESTRAQLELLVPDDDPPGPPTGFHATNVLGRRVDIAWSASAAADVRAYLLEKRDTGSTRIRMREVPVTAPREVRDTNVVHGRSYVYFLTAIDSAGNRSTAAVDSLRFGDPTPPPAPRNAYARRDSSGVTVRWERVIDAELAGYVVYRSDSETGVYAKVTPAAVNALQWIDRRATGSAWYQVRAVDRSGNESAPSPSVRVPQ
jgi:fibronectin type 3 domain-containing protein